MDESMHIFHPVVQRWFAERVGMPTPPQVLGWPHIAEGKSTLILAPTGSGKTLAAFLVAIDWLAKHLMRLEESGDSSLIGTQIVYVSPLKSLANDVEKNLKKPLEELAEVAAATKGEAEKWPEMTVGVRTGDTPMKTRTAMAKRPPHLLITTPESLNLILTGSGRGSLAGVRYLIVDEVHALAGNKRGVFLSLVLERLEELRTQRELVRGKVKVAPGVYLPAEELAPLVRVGLSATARPEEEIARWLGGYDDEGKERAVEIVRAGQRKRLDLAVVCPFGGGFEEEPQAEESKVEREVRAATHWREVTETILRMIREHRSTLVFGNSRRMVERMAAKFAEDQEAEGVKPEDAVKILPHHGSISKDARLETEQALKRGELDAVLATSSLELGIDVGAIDLVIQIDSPGNVAGALQRVGRAGHLEKATAKGRLLVRARGELPSMGALVPLMIEGRVEETTVPRNCLDVLAQQIVAACAVRARNRGDLYRLFRRATAYQGLSEKQFDSVVLMLSKRTERIVTAGLRPRLSFDRVNDQLVIMPGVAKVLTMNSGVIADTGQFPVYVATKEARADTKKKEDAAPDRVYGVRIGELDEEFVYETKEGDRVVLGSQTWRILRIDDNRVMVEPASAGPSRMPFWRGESAPRSELLGEAVAGFFGSMERHLKKGTEGAREWLTNELRFDESAADAAITYVSRQLAEGGLPTQERLVVEHFLDRAGEPVIAVLCSLGSRVNYALRLGLEAKFASQRLPVQVVHHDDGLMIRPPVETGAVPENPLAWLKAGKLEELISEQLEATALFGMRFRHNAARALMLPRMAVSQRTPLWQQRLRSRHLLALVKKQRNFPILIETYRECLQDAMNLPRAMKLLSDLDGGRVHLEVVRNAVASPMAGHVYSNFQQKYLYAMDDPIQAAKDEPTVDAHVIDEILQRKTEGRAAGAVAWEETDEKTLARRITGSDYPARTAEELLEKVEACGAAGVGCTGFDDAKWAAWAVGGLADARAMLGELVERRRLLFVVWGESVRCVGTEDAAVVIAAMGKRPQLLSGEWSELPAAMLATETSKADAQRVIVEHAVRQVATTSLGELRRELPWMQERVVKIVETLMQDGVVVRVPGERIAVAEYVEQLRMIALRRLRKLTNTHDVAALQRHLLHWHRVDGPREGVDALEDVLDQLTGVGLPLETWENDVLPSRVRDFHPALLDGLVRQGHWVWVGMGGEEGGGAQRVSFWPRQLLRERRGVGVELSDRAKVTLEFLRKQGASFLLDLQMGLTLGDEGLVLALSELVFAGAVSNDALESLRELMRLAELAGKKEREREDREDGVGQRYPAGFRTGGGVRSRAGMRSGWWKQQTAGGGGAALGGRWFVLPSGMEVATGLDAAERATERVERFLRRHGFACRELVEVEVDGPWREAYDVLTRMEWAGTVRRGYFVEGISGSQFSGPAVDLGERQGGSLVWLSMLDPANVWAAVAMRWTTEGGEATRISRTAGNWIALIEGRPVLAAVNWGARLIPLPASEEEQRRAVAAVEQLLERIPRGKKAMLEVREWEGRSILGTEAEEVLRGAGFARDTNGLRLYRHYAERLVERTNQRATDQSAGAVPPVDGDAK